MTFLQRFSLELSLCTERAVCWLDTGTSGAHAGRAIQRHEPDHEAFRARAWMELWYG